MIEAGEPTRDGDGDGAAMLAASEGGRFVKLREVERSSGGYLEGLGRALAVGKNAAWTTEATGATRLPLPTEPGKWRTGPRRAAG